MFVVYFEKQQGTTRDETNRFYNQDKLKKGATSNLITARPNDARNIQFGARCQVFLGSLLYNVVVIFTMCEDNEQSSIETIDRGDMFFIF